MFLEKIIHNAGGRVLTTLTIPATSSKLGPIPAELHLSVRQQVSERFPGGIYSHQAKALKAACEGKCVCVATPTASGKTLIFTSFTSSKLLNSPGGVALVLYPSRALIQDQYQRWVDFTAELDINVGIVDGGISIKERIKLLSELRVVLMTPDVLHSWLLANLSEIAIKRFIAALDLVVIDEAHVYDGVFGTNMAYLLRRLRAVSGVDQILAGSATVGAPSELLHSLTGLPFLTVGPSDDGFGRPEKNVLLCSLSPKSTSTLIYQLAAAYRGRAGGRLLAFADSRKRVEQIAAEQSRLKASELLEKVDEIEPDQDDEEEADDSTSSNVLPYRAGYEEDDRRRIQRALTDGKLVGVVATSALELGIDIGDIETVVLIGLPGSIKSFWQRVGRAGRKRPGYVIIIDTDDRMTSGNLGEYVTRSPEPNWLYLANEYLQYANALCAAQEFQECPEVLYSQSPFSNLPASFMEMLRNELKPTRPIAQELYPLKQHAQNGPHRAFPVRTGAEKNYSVTCKQLPGKGLGTMTYPQVLREAFPGAIYRYMGKPYRVLEIKHYVSEIVTVKTKGFGSTSPLVQSIVFPQFSGQIYQARRSENSWLAECRLQVSERVIGFKEKVGNRVNEQLYQSGSSYSQKPLNRYFDTSGVCFHFADEELQKESIAKYVALAFCRVCSVQERDVGYGVFYCQSSPWDNSAVRGFAVYDATLGSLRLTRQIPENAEAIINEAWRMAQEESANKVTTILKQIQGNLRAMKECTIQVHPTSSVVSSESNGEWVRVIAAEQVAILNDGKSHQDEEVNVLRYLYTPQGLMYKLRSARTEVEWQVAANFVREIPGVTRVEFYNVNTGEVHQTR